MFISSIVVVSFIGVGNRSTLRITTDLPQVTDKLSISYNPYNCKKVRIVHRLGNDFKVLFYKTILPHLCYFNQNMLKHNINCFVKSQITIPWFSWFSVSCEVSPSESEPEASSCNFNPVIFDKTKKKASEWRKSIQSFNTAGAESNSNVE